MTPEDTPRDSVPLDGTFRLRPSQPQAAPPPDTSTVQLGATAPMPVYQQAPAPTPTVFVPGPAPAPSVEPPAESLIRFGPGVPDPKTARTMAVWKGAAPAGAPAAGEGHAKPKKRKLGGFLLAGLVLLAVVAYLLWNRLGSDLSVTSVAVTASPATLSCNSTEHISAAVKTNGSSGTIHYRWVRSDGTNSGGLTRTVPSGVHEVSLPLLWTVQGSGHLEATATIEISDPGTRSAAASFSYSCSS